MEYSRHLTEKDKISLSYSYTTINILSEAESSFVQEAHLADTNNVGQIEFRQKYHHIDLYYTRTLVNIGKRQSVKALGGIAFANGLNVYKDYLYVTLRKGRLHIVDAGYSRKRESYWGGVIGVRYDYMLFGDRVSIGADGLLRSYFGDYHTFFNYRLRAGFHF